MLRYHIRFGLELFLCSYAHLNSLVTIFQSPATQFGVLTDTYSDSFYKPSDEENYHCNRLWGPIGLCHVEPPILCRH
jgi:hypothetical protein